MREGVTESYKQAGVAEQWTNDSMAMFRTSDKCGDEKLGEYRSAGSAKPA